MKIFALAARLAALRLPVMAVSLAAAVLLAQAQTAADGQAAFARGDYAQAERLWRPLAERGDAAAQTGMGNLYVAGRGVAQDAAAAAVWFGKAAEQGNPVAQHVLASLYLRGNGVVQDDAAAARWYRRAAEQGYVPAQSGLGFMLENGRSAPRDEPQAAAWYRKAAERGDALATANLGAMADEGRGVVRDPVLGAALLARANELAPARQEIATMAQAAQGRLQPAQRQEADAMRASMATPAGLAATLARLAAAGPALAAAAAAPAATPAAPMSAAAPTTAPPTAVGDTELQGTCRLFSGDLASAGPACPDRAVISMAGGVPVIRVVDGATRRVVAELRFDNAHRMSSGDGAANLNVESVNGQPAGGTCGYQYPGGLRPQAGSASPTITLTCGASSMGPQSRPLLSWGLAVFKAAPGERERWTAALDAVRDKLNPAMSDSALAVAQAEAQRRAATTPALPSAPPPAPARPSDDPKAIFGLLVGSKMPSMRACRDGQDMAKDQPWCFERDNSGNSSLANLLTERAELYRKAGAVPFQVKVNDEVFDTSLLFAIPLLGNLPWIELWVGRDQTIHMLRVNTRLAAFDGMSQLLTRKYGKPTRRDDTEWRHNQTGQIVRRTPNLRWNLPDLAIDYESQMTGMLFNEPGSSGTLTIHAADFARKVGEIERQSAPPPKRGM